MNLRLSFVVCILLLSCQRKQTEPAIQNDVSQQSDQPSDTITSGHNAMISPDSSASPETDKTVVPVSFKPIKILFTGMFHGDEVEEDVSDLPWLGLFTDENAHFLLKKTTLIANRVLDGILDDPENGEMTGWEIRTEKDEYPTMLVTGGEFTEGNVETAEVPGTINPGDSSQFDFKGIHYLMYATGSAVPDSVRGVTYVSDYNLFVVRTEKGERRSTLLVSHPAFDEAMTSIIWSGDLDNDGYLDLLIDMSNHYNRRSPTLFLSKPAGNDKIVVPVAEHSSVGC